MTPAAVDQETPPRETPPAEVVVGIDLGGTKVYGGLVDEAGRLSGERFVAHGLGAQGFPAVVEGEAAAQGPAFAALVQAIEALVAQAGDAPIRGVGVGVPAMVRDGGVVASAAALGWREVPLEALLTRRLGLPVRVENDVNLQALGEATWGAARGARTAFCMTIGTGIGGAVLVDGRLWRGRHFAAGEIGLMLPGREFLGWRDRDWGAFEAVASGTGLAAEARAALAAAGEPGAAPRADEVFAAADAGAPWALALLERTFDLYAVALSAVQGLLDPDVVVLSGGVAAQAARIREAVERRLAPALPHVPRIVPSALGYRAGVLGAWALLASS